MICSILDENVLYIYIYIYIYLHVHGFQNFRGENFNFQDKERSGQPKKGDDHELKQLLNENCHQNQGELDVTQPSLSIRLHKLGRIQK